MKWEFNSKNFIRVMLCEQLGDPYRENPQVSNKTSFTRS